MPEDQACWSKPLKSVAADVAGVAPDVPDSRQLICAAAISAPARQSVVASAIRPVSGCQRSSIFLRTNHAIQIALQIAAVLSTPTDVESLRKLGKATGRFTTGVSQSS